MYSTRMLVAIQLELCYPRSSQEQNVSSPTEQNIQQGGDQLLRDAEGASNGALYEVV